MSALEKARILTVRQPWASAIAYGLKDVENRDWVTAYRGPVAIHAGVNLDRQAYVEFPGMFAEIPPLEALPVGKIIAVVDLVDITRESTSVWAQPDKVHWCLANPRMLAEPIPFKGALGLLWLDADILAELNTALEESR